MAETFGFRTWGFMAGTQHVHARSARVKLLRHVGSELHWAEMRSKYYAMLRSDLEDVPGAPAGAPAHDTGSLKKLSDPHSFL